MSPIFISLVATICVFTALWFVHVLKNDAGIVDIFWGPGFLVIAIILWITNGASSTPQLIFLLITAAWALRLGFHIGLRHQKADKEDRRYARMRANGGDAFWWKSLFKVFLLQAVLMWIIAAPHHAGLVEGSVPIESGFWLIFTVGMLLFAIGFLIETVADFQLSRFKAESKAENQTFTGGLWAYSRHPNYFGEAVLWWGFGCCGFALSGAHWAFLGPVLITFLIIKVSGISMLEDHLAPEKTGYSDYQQSTSAFIPWPKRR